MAEIFLTNSLSRRKEKFFPLNEDRVTLYTCGPTVYDFTSIGNFRTYLTGDFLLRVLKFNGYEVDYVMNLTDVGHLTGDNLGDADSGEDRIEKKAEAMGESAWEISKRYSESFISDFEKLNLVKPKVFSKATDHIEEQINLVKSLEEKGFIYRISDGIYFDTELFEEKTGKKYGEISDLDKIKEGARVERNPEKKNPKDFALWKFSPKEVKRQMEWDSPWGKGFPGWHLECSAMSMKYLGETIDIHLGGEDLKQTHHPNEIAQSEASTGKQFVNYWIHVTFLRVDGKRMGKSLGNFYTVKDIEKRGFDPLSLRYLYLTSHYRDSLNFTWESLSSAQNALERLRSQTISLREDRQRTALSSDKNAKIEKYREEFTLAVNDDLNLPKALAVLWEMLKGNLPSIDKYDLLLLFDEVLGLNLDQVQKKVITEDVAALIKKRNELRMEGKYEEADKVRKEIEAKGVEVKDDKVGAKKQDLS